MPYIVSFQGLRPSQTVFEPLFLVKVLYEFLLALRWNKTSALEIKDAFFQVSW